MGAFSELDIMGQELQLHLGATGRVFQDDKGQWIYRSWAGTEVPAHSCEAAVLYLRSCCDGARDTDGKGFSGYDAEFGHSLAGGIERYGRLSEKQLYILQRTKEKDGKNGLLMKYKKQLEEVGFYLPALLEQKPVVKDKEPPKEYTITAKVTKESQSGAGLLVKQISTGKEEWVPKKSVKIDGDKITFPEWLWKQKPFEQELTI